MERCCVRVSAEHARDGKQMNQPDTWPAWRLDFGFSFPSRPSRLRTQAAAPERMPTDPTKLLALFQRSIREGTR